MTAESALARAPGLAGTSREISAGDNMDSSEGPPRGARIAPERVKAELKSAGYAFVQGYGFLPTQYFLVFRPASSISPQRSDASQCPCPSDHAQPPRSRATKQM